MMYLFPVQSLYDVFIASISEFDHHMMCEFTDVIWLCDVIIEI